MARYSFWAYSGCWSAFSEAGSERWSVLLDRLSRTCGPRRRIKIGWPRQAGIGPSRAPSSTRLISMVTGAPAARARALGFQEPTKGTAAPTAPAAPTREVLPTRKRLRLLLTAPLLTRIFSCKNESEGRPGSRILCSRALPGKECGLEQDRAANSAHPTQFCLF